MLLVDGRVGIRSGDDGVRGSMAALAVGHIGIAAGTRATVNAALVLGDFLLVTTGAELGAGDSSRHIAGRVAGDTGLRIFGIAERRVDTGRERLRRVTVARQARGGGGSGVMALRRRAGMAVDAAQSAMGAFHMRRWIDADAFALGIFQAD